MEVRMDVRLWWSGSGVEVVVEVGLEVDWRSDWR